MNLIEVSVHADGEAAEALSELFNRLGHGGAVIEETPEPRNVTVRTYLLCDEHIDANRRAIEEGLWHLAQLYPIPPAEFRELKEDDWANAWKSFHPVQHVGKHLVLKPTWCEYEPRPDDLVIHLDPGMAFGTGQHPSTRFCLLALEQHMHEGMRVLDVGTGSGILAITAVKLGAREVFACDVDPIAVNVARENIALNHVADQVHLGIGSLGDWDLVLGSISRVADAPTHDVDFIIINILAPVIIELLPLARPLLRADGYIALSGLIATQEDAVRAKMGEVGLRVVERQQEDDWVMLVGKVNG